ncbi:MAG: Poly (3-hydroxybutyrate) depolymerase [Rhodocyclaceae bacterium]|nr:Poly (3-hydroxybutyrate) depolymerase [Rhodocyclaceae bacterium]
MNPIPSSRFCRAAFLAACLLALARSGLADPFPALPALNVDIAETSVSGISSGAFMSVQFQVAHSSIVKGAGVVAGGPYYCAQDDAIRATTQCTCTLDPLHQVCSVSPTSADVPALEKATRDFAQKNLIDNPDNLARQRVYVFAGGKDELVPAPVIDQLDDYYRRLAVPAANVKTERWAKAGHTMPTMRYGNACPVTDTPYISDCNFDGAKEILTWIYGPLATAKKTKKPKAGGRFIQFDQTPYLPASQRYSWTTGMDQSGWLYLPAACERGEPCRLHVAFHGCKQGQSYALLRPLPDGSVYYGTTFVRHAGYDTWADANRIAVLFPQAVSIPGLNPNGCWDWWGYTDGNYATRKGVQISTVRAMIDRIASGKR